MSKYESVIGLEVHLQLSTDTKIFCGCSAQFGAAPNTNVCPVCTAMPGVLPVLNKKAVEYAIKAALATNCKINPVSIFARKHYFYPDLPKNYQISQYELPLAEHGIIELESGKKIGLTRIHMEEDAGKLLHDIGGRDVGGSLVDYNRTGVPLIEIVSEPDIRTPQEAYEYLNILKSIMKYLGISDCNMEEGSLRCDANISIREKGVKELGTKAEIKNMNSFRGVQKAIAYEIDRQIYAVESGERIVQETRLWESKKEITVSMRSKEEAHDYKYFPEPDLAPLRVSSEWIEEVKNTLPELEKERKTRLVKDYQIPEYDAGVLTKDKDLADYFEETIKDNKDNLEFIKLAVTQITVELLGRLNKESLSLDDSKIKPKDIAELVTLIKKEVISGKIAKTVFEEMFEKGESPEKIVKDKGLVQITDESALKKIVQEVIDENEKVVNDYRSGNPKVAGFLVGQIMKKTAGKANPSIANKLLKELL